MEEFIEACKNGNLEVVRLLLNDPRVGPSAKDNYAIRLASYNGHLEVVRLLLSDSRVDPSARENFAIRWASERGHLEVVRLLLSDLRVDPSENYAIRWASERGHLEVVRLLLNDPRVLRDNQDALKQPIVQKILKESKDKKAAIMWIGKIVRKEWRYICPDIAINIRY